MEQTKTTKQRLHQTLEKLVLNDLKGQSQKANVLKKLPESFWNFMKERQIKIDDVLVQIPRFIRLKEPFSKSNSNEPQQIQIQNQKNMTQITEKELIQDLNIKENQIVKINDQCYALAPSCKINHSKLYQKGLLYGMDISSMFAVNCLDLQENSKVLELCSAPGNKSMYACDLQPGVQVIGVQINQTRANVMKNLIQKYNLSDRIKIMVEDATKFDSQQLFDRVLVDAQCTHEGSVKHLKKFTKEMQTNIGKTKNDNKKIKNNTKQQEKQFQANHNPYTSLYDKKNQWTTEDFQKRFLDPVKLSNLYELQLNLIKNGFKLLKPEGIMVYSTCSIDSRQNQSIVQQLLDLYPQQAVLIDTQDSLKNCPLFYRKGTLKQTAYFTPKFSMCGGMFISKIKKINCEKKSQQIKQNCQNQQNITSKISEN